MKITETPRTFTVEMTEEELRHVATILGDGPDTDGKSYPIYDAMMDALEGE